MFVYIYGVVLYCRACRMLAQVILIFPMSRRAHRSGAEAAATVGAHVSEDIFNAGATERTLEGANHGLG